MLDQDLTIAPPNSTAHTTLDNFLNVYAGCGFDTGCSYFWIAVLFTGFGLFARFNATVIAAVFIGALSVSGAIFLILELNHPYEGVMRISGAPLRSRKPRREYRFLLASNRGSGFPGRAAG